MNFKTGTIIYFEPINSDDNIEDLIERACVWCCQMGYRPEQTRLEVSDGVMVVWK